MYRRIVHHGPCIYCHIFAILNVSTRLPSSLNGFVLKVIHHEAAIMYNFCEAASVENLWRDLSKALGIDHAEYGAPALATTVKEVVCGFEEALKINQNERTLTLLTASMSDCW